MCLSNLHSAFPPLSTESSIKPSLHLRTLIPISQNLNTRTFLLPNFLSLTLTVTLASSPLSLALPSLSSQSSLIPPTTPFSQSKNLQVGLEDGKIRPCPSINPGCVSTNPKSSSFAFPWRIPVKYSENAIQKLQEAILRTQRNAKIQVVEDTSDGNWTEFNLNIKWKLRNVWGFA